MLYPGAEFPPGEACLPLENELILLDLEDPDDDGGEKPEKAEAEALAAAKKIDDLISGGYQILTKNGYRTISYRDICILLRATKAWAPVFSQVFSQYGICLLYTSNTTKRQMQPFFSLFLNKLRPNLKYYKNQLTQMPQMGYNNLCTFIFSQEYTQFEAVEGGKNHV